MSSQFANKGRPLVETASVDEIAEDTASPISEPNPEQVIAEIENERDFAASVFSINSYPPYQPEEQNPNILIKGRWLERGGSAWWISTAGTGKSIASVQAAYCWGDGKPFAGLTPHRAITSWIIQSEDSPSRITIDREDIMAELGEQMPDTDWKDVANRRVFFVKCNRSICGVSFFKEIGRLLEIAQQMDKDNEGVEGYVKRMPDLLIINPFLAFVGGPVTDGGYVTPFLRGGVIGNQQCEGLQPFLEWFNIAALIYHHTPKPPNEKEVAAWMKSTFPEYQGAGSSDITNWGRSFITMMKCPGHPHVVCLCAGKNGSEIGWEQIGGSTRHYIAWSDGVSITGGRRHAWRELNDDEREEIVEKQMNDAEKNAEEDAKVVADAIRESKKAYSAGELKDFAKAILNSRDKSRRVAAILFADPKRFGLFVRERNDGRGKPKFISASVSTIDTTAMHERESAAKQVQYEKHMDEQRERERKEKRGLGSGKMSDLPEMPPNVEPQEPTVELQQDNDTQETQEDADDEPVYPY